MNNRDEIDILLKLTENSELTSEQIDVLNRQLRTDWITDNLQARRRMRPPYGLDADKETNPPVGAVYLATDTKKLYCCYTAGVWEI